MGILFLTVAESMPRRKTGKCPWCGKHRRPLVFHVYTQDGQYHAEYICERCMKTYEQALREKIREENREWL